MMSTAPVAHRPASIWTARRVSAGGDIRWPGWRERWDHGLMNGGAGPGRLDLMDAALAGLSVGDAFGDQFFLAANRGLSPDDEPPGPWEWSDDTELACSVADVLRRLGRIDQDELAAMSAARFDPSRRYGAGLWNCWSRYGPACHGGKPARRSSAAGAPTETAARCGSPRWALTTSGTRPEPQLRPRRRPRSHMQHRGDRWRGRGGRRGLDTADRPGPVRRSP